MKAGINNENGITLIVVLNIMAILLSVIGAGLFFSGINTKVAMNYRTGSMAFNAADTGINAVVSTLTPASPPSTVPVPLGDSLCYRYGKRDGTVPAFQPSVRSSAGYSLGANTGYNTSGYSFYQYTINVTGTFSPALGCPAVGDESAAREVEAQALYGPVVY